MKHEAVFFGSVHRRYYRFDKYENGWGSYTSKPRFYNETYRIDEKEFLRVEIDNPPLEINEKVFIEEINNTVRVIDRVRNAKGGYIYYTDYIIDVIEDEETEKSKQQAEKQQEEYNSQPEVSIVKEEPQKLSKKWYEFWK